MLKRLVAAVASQPMAAAMMRHLYGHRVFVASCGVRAGEDDPFVHVVMDEIGITLGRHRPQSFDDLDEKDRTCA